MQNPTDITLLKRWREQRDAVAFRTLTQRYGGMVFGICNRVLRNPADAEEVTQDCFLKLAQHPATAERAVGPWLHSVAVRGSLDRVRSERRRRDRELAYDNGGRESGNDSAQDLLAQIDEAIHVLSPDLRGCVVTHFLEGRSQAEAAAHLGISERTVRRRSTEAIERIREFLNDRGVVTSASLLTVSLTRLNAQALSPALEFSLGKLAIGAKANASAALNTYGSFGGILAMKKTIGISLGVALIGLAAWWQFGGKPEVPVSSTDGLKMAEVIEPAVSQGTNSPAPLETASEHAGNPVSEGAAVSPEPATPEPKSYWPLLADPKVYAPEPLADPTKAATVTGMVVDSIGRAIPGAAVRLLLTGSGVPDAHAVADAGRLAYAAHIARQNEVANDPTFQRAAQTDDSGAFLFNDIRFTGSFVVSASAGGFTPGSAAGALESESTVEVNVSLGDGQAMYGRVITPSGQPVPDASVASIGLLGEGQVFGTTPPWETLRDRTDSKGNFTLWLKDLDRDREWFTGLHIKSAKYGEGFFYPVRIDTDERTIVTLESQLARLSGTIDTGDGEPAKNYHIQISGMATISSGTSSISNPGSFFETETSEDGGYVFEALPSLESFTAYIYGPDGRAAALRPLPALTAGEDKTWDCTLDAPIQVTGEVRSLGAGNPLPGIMVRYVSDEEGSNVSGHTFSDTNGAFSFTVLSGGGDYTFHARYQRDGRTGMNENMEATVALKPGEKKFVLLEIPAPWSRTFKIVDPFGAPVPGVHGNETLEFPGYGSSTTSRMEVTDDDGLVTFDLIDPAATTFYYMFRDGYIAADTERIEGQPGEALSVETFVLYQSAVVVARLVDGDGAPIANAKVDCEATYADGRRTSAKSATDADGWITFPGELPAAETALHFTIEAAEGEARLEAHIQGAALNPDTENDLGEIVLAPGA